MNDDTANRLSLPEIRETGNKILQLDFTDEQLQDMVHAANVPALLMATIHLTGDDSILTNITRGPVSVNIFDVSDGFRENEKEMVRKQALEVLRSYRRHPRALPAFPAEKMMTAMLHFITGEVVPDKQKEMLWEDFFAAGKDKKSVDWNNTKTPVSKRAGFQVMVIGAGMSGILAAIKLQEAGISFTVLEKNKAIGGTWYKNTYPGCRVDIMSHLYCYSFEPLLSCPHFFPTQDFMRQYFTDCSHKYKIAPHIRLGHTVTAMKWEEDRQEWEVGVTLPDGQTEIRRCNAVINATGQLHHPAIPDIPGMASFAGPCFHTADYNQELDLSGKRVGVIGTGSSGIQVATALSGSVKELLIFQRTPHWATPVDVYQEEVPQGKHDAMQHIPYYSNWYRLLLFWRMADGMNHYLVKDPAWKSKDESVNAFNGILRSYLIRHMKKETDSDPALITRIVPDYPPYGKRMLIDNDWYKTLSSPHVTLISGGVREMVPNGLVDQQGETHSVDAIILATGFKPFHPPFSVTGRAGITLLDAWGGAAQYSPRAYLGITMPGFPNYFMTYGPNTNVGTTFSIITISEFQVRYIITCMKEMLENDYSAIEPLQTAYAAYNAKVDAQLEKLVWNHPKVNSWYNSWPGKRSATNLPFSIADYRQLLLQPDMAAFIKYYGKSSPHPPNKVLHDESTD
ncbi:flavin-containing monooxygenase [Chitinophaga nivalis]|uniref:NAD(P)/FAD-dependent oxidoreductase n=1 Tax=Chitinophaga nivalis TaxID=2991709 RepID=A0ABT3IMX6_9BACT|nr:NAD(P)/FAD-dependent oxidoreductase [Chitinophaga nivalis]MCW3464999.1 NAD(P)/FAD-dependent oxidoreductase [Chitinophaga nivalis]MCW3485309.1 NAD(P)/FAD-dependent oxidoreductase [Chitinophaga nivalis]